MAEIAGRATGYCGGKGGSMHIVAKELATLDFLSRGRLFPAFGLGGDESKDLLAVGVNKKERAARADEAIRLMRRLWTEENVTFEGKFYSMGFPHLRS